MIGYVETATKNALQASGWNWQSNNGSWHRVFRTVSGVDLTLGEGSVATPQQVEDAIAQANPSPEALRDIVEKTGRVPTPDPADPTELKSPQPSPEKTTTKTNPDGSTETTKCQTLGILQGIDIRMVEECTTTMKDPAGNTTSTTTTTSDDADPKESDADEGVPTDSPLGEVPRLYEPKYPGGIVGVWNAKKVEFSATPLMGTLATLMPNVGSVGTCPTWQLDIDLGFFDAGVRDVAPPCWVWDFAKVVLILSALMLARSLIFGG